MTDARLRIAVVAGYPSQQHPHVRTFVRALVEQWALLDVDVAVIAPQRGWETAALELEAPVDPARRAPHVARPRCLSFSNKRLPGGFSTYCLTVGSSVRAVERAARELPFEPDIIYGHFLFSSGLAALRVARERRIPAVVALGESDLSYYELHLGLRRTADAVGRFDGILSVSFENRDYLVKRFGIAAEKVAVVPNAADQSLFRPRDKAEVRRELGLPAERPILAFTGHFTERKGPGRVLAAIRSHPEVGVVFLGQGVQRPEGDQVLFADRVSHDEVADYLSAADAFVLPTLAEGSPNAIVEAMACGLPIISSDIPSVRETVDPAAAILVDPLDEAALSRAIGEVLGDPDRRADMSRAARARGTQNSLTDRAERILGWLEGIVAAR